MQSGYCGTIRVTLACAQLLVKSSVHTCVRDFDADANRIGTVVHFAGPRIPPDRHSMAAGVEADAIERAALKNRSVTVDHHVSEHTVTLCFPAADGAIGTESFGIMDDNIERHKQTTTLDRSAFGGGEPMLPVDLADRSFRRRHACRSSDSDRRAASGC